MQERARKLEGGADGPPQPAPWFCGPDVFRIMERPGGLDTLAERWGGMTKAVATAGIAFFPRFVGHDYDNGHYTLVIVDNIDRKSVV